MGDPVVRITDEHGGCTLCSGVSVDVRVAPVRVNGKQPAAAAGPTKCMMGAGAHGPGQPNVVFKGIGPAIGVGQPTACGGVEAQGSPNVHLTAQGGGWGKAFLDWLDQPADPVLNARLNAIADIEKSISYALKAGIAATAPDPTISKAATVFLTGQAINTGVPAVTQLFTGTKQTPLVDQGVDKLGKTLGASAEQTEIAKNIVDTTGNILGGKLEAKAGIGKMLEGHVSRSIVSRAGKPLKAGTYKVGPYNQIHGTVSGLDAHHVGQKALMGKLIKGYDPDTAPAILVPKFGHTTRGPNGIVSRNMTGLTTARDVVARDIRELRRVYPGIPNKQLQELIKANKLAYPKAFKKR